MDEHKPRVMTPPKYLREHFPSVREREAVQYLESLGYNVSKPGEDDDG